MQKYKILLLASIVGSTPAMAALQALGDHELDAISGEEGITIGMRGEVNSTLAFKDNDIGSTAQLVFKDMGGDFKFSDLKVDVTNMGTGVAGKRALQIGLPSKLEGRRFALGDLTLSVDPLAKQEITAQKDLNQELTDPPKREKYQVVLTASNYRFRGDTENGKASSVGTANDVFNTDLGINELELHIADMGGKRNDKLQVDRNGAGKLKIEGWHTYGTTNKVINKAYLDTAEAQREAYAKVDKGNLGMSAAYKQAVANPTLLNAGAVQHIVRTTAASGSNMRFTGNDYAFTKGLRNAYAHNKPMLSHDSDKKAMTINPHGVGFGSTKVSREVALGYMRTTNVTNGDKNTLTGPTALDAKVAKYSIALTSRIDRIDSDKFIVGKGLDQGPGAVNNPTTKPRYEDYYNDAFYPSANGQMGHYGQAGCYDKGTTLNPNYKCEARPIVDGLSWFVDNKNYSSYDPSKATSDPSYYNSYAGYQELLQSQDGKQLAHDPRVLFTVGKQTEVRIQALNIRCSRWCGYDFGEAKDPKKAISETNKIPAPRPIDRFAAIDPAVVLLDENGKVLAYDVSSGGINLNGEGKPIEEKEEKYFDMDKRFGSKVAEADFLQQIPDDQGYYPMAMLELTLGDSFINTSKYRKVSGISFKTAPEISEHHLTTSQRDANKSIQLNMHNSKVQVFGIK